jgi:type I restriction enzyme R subunit
MAVNAETDEQRKKYEAQVHDLIGSDISLHDKQDLIKIHRRKHAKMINGQSVQVALLSSGMKRTGLSTFL